jgi:malate dehydrogenase (oxaloacetate-decarboxylating)(NADP+)
VFNDDIESTAAAVVAAVYGAARLPDVPPLADQHFVFVGAGQANIGSARLLCRALQDEGAHSVCTLPSLQVCSLISFAAAP